MTEKHQCSKQAIMDTWGHTAPCEHNATILEDGKWWCGSHAPSRVAARRAKTHDKWVDNEAQQRDLIAHQQALMQAQAELLVAAKAMATALERYGSFIPKREQLNLKDAIAKLEEAK